MVHFLDRQCVSLSSYESILTSLSPTSIAASHSESSNYFSSIIRFVSSYGSLSFAFEKRGVDLVVVSEMRERRLYLRLCNVFML